MTRRKPGGTDLLCIKQSKTQKLLHCHILYREYLAGLEIVMEQLFVYAVIVLLATYGLVVLLKEFISSRRGSAGRSEGVRLVLLVKNRERDIEWIIRKTLADGGVLARKCQYPIIVADMDSDDETCSIVHSLTMEYDELELVAYKDRDKIFEGQSLKDGIDDD